MRITRIASTARMDLAASIVPAKATLTIFGYIGDAQGFTTTRDGIYAAAGAQGSNSNDQGGFGGAPASAIVTLPNGVELTIVIGGKGGSDDSSPLRCSSGGGGGGSFVSTSTGLLAAAGGGGSFHDPGSANQLLTADTNLGSGFVSIELLPALPASVPGPASAALLSLGGGGPGRPAPLPCGLTGWRPAPAPATTLAPRAAALFSAPCNTWHGGRRIMLAPDTQQFDKPGLHARCGTAVVRAVALAAAVAVLALNPHGMAAAQAPVPDRLQQQASGHVPQTADPYLHAVVCRPDPGADCLCSRGPGGRETSYPELQAEIAAYSTVAEPPDAKQRHTEWRRQCGITSDEDTWP